MSDVTQPVGVQFAGIDVLHHVVHPLLPGTAKPTVGFSISMQYQFSQVLEQVQLELDIQVQDIQTQRTVGELKTCCTFSLKGVAQLNSETGIVTIDDNVIDMFVSLSISTTRGILYSYFANTYLNPLVLPVIDPKAFRQLMTEPTPHTGTA